MFIVADLVSLNTACEFIENSLDPNKQNHEQIQKVLSVQLWQRFYFYYLMRGRGDLNTFKSGHQWPDSETLF